MSEGDRCDGVMGAHFNAVNANNFCHAERSEASLSQDVILSH